MYLRLAAAGHSVRAFAADLAARRVLRGMVERVDDWRDALPWIRGAGKDGVIVFETAKNGALQDELREAGYPVIGGGLLGDRLEGERAFGQEALRGVGLRTAPTRAFRDFAEAIAFVREHPGRYVYKPNGHQSPSSHTYVGALDDGVDLVAMLNSHRRALALGDTPDFVLMEHVSGVEVGVGAYFNGAEFIRPACLDWEHKRFFNGDLGELTGEMGTVVTYRGSDRLFEETLLQLAPLLARGGYQGYVNLNTVVNDDGIWPLEFTCRFGYPGYAILDALQTDGWERILRAMLGSADTTFATGDGYAVGVVLTTPPFPRASTDPSEAADLPVTIVGGLDATAERHLHFAEIERSQGGFVTSGASGYVLVATGTGADVPAAQTNAYRLLARVVVPSARYRTDIGDRFEAGDRQRLERLGYLPPRKGRGSSSR